MIHVLWLKDKIGRKAGAVFTMGDKTLFDAWKSDGCCKKISKKEFEEHEEDKAEAEKVARAEAMNVEERGADLDAREAACDEREAACDTREAGIDDRDKAATEREAALKEAEDALANAT